MKFKKWSLLLALGLALSMILAACGGNDSSKGSDGKASSDGEATLAKEQVLDVNIGTEPPALHPGKATDTTSITVLDQVFEGLTRINEDGEPEEAMAEKIEISEDRKTYTFTIRDGVKWSNGDPVTAQDFESAWKWVLNPKSTDTDFAYYLYYIKNAEAAKKGDVSLDEVGVTAKDDKTLVVELEQPTPYFLDLTAFSTYYPVNHNVVEGNDEWATEAGEQYVTNGPFTLESWTHKDQIVLKKNPNYWDADSVKLETVNMYMIEDANTELQMYNNGELDWAGSPTGTLPLAAVPALKQEGTLNISPLAGVYFYEFNVEKEPFNNANIRKALSYAINRKGIVKNITKRDEQPATAFVPPSMWDGESEGYFKDNNVDKAKELLEKGLKELGLEEMPTIKLSYNTDEAHASIAQAIQDMWRENLGVEVELNNEEWNVYLDSLSNGNYQLGRMGWLAGFNDPINFLDIFRAIGGNNYSNWVNEEYSSLLEQSKAETDPVKREEILKDAEAILMDEMPIAPVYFYTNAWLNKDYVKNLTVQSTGNIYYRFGYITEH